MAQLTIILTQDDLGELSEHTVQEILALSMRKSRIRQSAKQPLMLPAPDAESKQVTKKGGWVVREPFGTVTMPDVMRAIREHPGKTTRELAELLYPGELPLTVRVNRCQSHVTRLLQTGKAERRSPGGEIRNTLLFPARRRNKDKGPR